ncbi:hypothetical protein TrLO_g3029 [Triparma laevis f. longispina]|nr:hypothetical protein TrLO_g3029 [Triparma laevis f. longispina]
MTKILTTTFILTISLLLPPSIFLSRLLTRFTSYLTFRKPTPQRLQSTSIRTSCFLSRLLLTLIPFCSLKLHNSKLTFNKRKIFICNHQSMLDIFILMSVGGRVFGRGEGVKIIYWKGAEDNLVTRYVFRSCGHIPVSMTSNAPGEENVYDPSSFKNLLKSVKSTEFDLGILPEGQLNPTPERGLLPIYTGAETLKRILKAEYVFMGLKGTGEIWHPVEGIVGRGRKVEVKVFGEGGEFEEGMNKLEEWSMN